MEPGSGSPKPHKIKHQIDLGVTGRAEVTKPQREGEGEAGGGVGWVRGLILGPWDHDLS
uniref:Uncharacterized protein n=1 Tax=Canis lupus dingo TaxID=286419 RepID=A0A8C0JHJ7_CANLU